MRLRCFTSDVFADARIGGESVLVGEGLVEV